MSNPTLLADFDRGVTAAQSEYAGNSSRDTGSEFDDRYASFTLYDVSAVKGGDKEKPVFVCLDLTRKEQPILWKHLHQALGEILRNDPDIKSRYAGFATLFTINRDVGPASPFGRPRWPSMAIDASLDRPGFKHAELSRMQFERPGKESPLPLTAACLNVRGDVDFVTTPIIFHWTKRSGKHIWSRGRSVDSTSRGLHSWAHVFVSADIPYDDTKGEKNTGLKTKMDWSQPFCNFQVEDLHGSLDKTALLARLRGFEGKENLEDLVLINQLAWTVTYFAYAAECYNNLPPGSLSHLSIVCAPASYERIVSTGLYVPVLCQTKRQLDRAAFKILYLARALGLPLEQSRKVPAAREQGTYEGTDKTIDVFAHQIRETAAAVGDGWLVSQQNWQRALKAFADLGSNDLKQKAQDYKIAPVPELYRALRITLSVWAQSRRWQDLFRTLTAPPATLQQMVEIAFDYAKDVRFVVAARNMNFNDDPVAELTKLWHWDQLDFLKRNTHLRITGEAASITRLVCPSTKAWESHLCDLLRLLLAIFDNYMGRGDTQKPVDVQCTLTKSHKYYEISISNYLKTEGMDVRSSVWPGMRGMEVIKEFTRRLSGEILHSGEVSSGPRYSIGVRLPMEPLWEVGEST